MKVTGQGDIARDSTLHCGMPSIIRLHKGGYLCAWRQAPDRRLLGRPQTHHCDTNAYLYCAISHDGRHWSAPRLLYAHPLGGCQDPCLFQTQKGTLLCSSYGYVLTEAEFPAQEDQLHYGPYHFLGGFMLRSEDGGNSWSDDQAELPRFQTNAMRDYSGQPYHPFNRGSFAQDSSSGRIFWAATRHHPQTRRGVIDLLISDDDGRTWKKGAPLADAIDHGLNETSLVLPPDGRLRAYIRSMADHDLLYMATARDSTNASFGLKKTRVQGHPWHASTLADDRILLVSGYRHRRNQVHARLLDPPNYNPEDAEKLVVRDGGGSWDIGYPWGVPLESGRALIVYYWHEDNDERSIEWSELSL